jgi:hypothetical protein
MAVGLIPNGGRSITPYWYIVRSDSDDLRNGAAQLVTATIGYWSHFQTPIDKTPSLLTKTLPKL